MFIYFLSEENILNEKHQKICMKELICFDLDNTLLKSERAHVNAYNHALEKYGFKKREFEDMVKLFGKPHKEVIKILIKKDDQKIIARVYNEKKKFLIKHASRYVKPIPGVNSVLKTLKKTYDLAVLSNSSHDTVLALMKAARLDRRYFKIIVGHDDVHNSKPRPDEIIKAEHLAHHKAKCMVGDSIYDVMAGKSAGVMTIAVLTGRYTKEELKKCKPDYIISHLRELLSIV